MNDTVWTLLNEQIQVELYSAYLYLGFSGYFGSTGLQGFRHWYEVQAQEELSHAFRIFHYLIDSGKEVKLMSVAAPTVQGGPIRAVVERALTHEQYVTGRIHKIVKAAQDSDDFATVQFLGWFVKEQTEEEENANDIITKVNMTADEGTGLYLLDRALAKR